MEYVISIGQVLGPCKGLYHIRGTGTGIIAELCCISRTGTGTVVDCVV